MKKSAMRVHPIRSEQDYDRAVARIGELIGAAPSSDKGDELDVLATLVDAYETRHYAVDAPDPLAAIQFRMEQQRLTRKDLEPLIGSRARVSEILNRKRSLTLEMVRRLKFGLGIPADSLIGSTTGTAPDRTRPVHKAHPAKYIRERSGVVQRVKKAAAC